MLTGATDPIPARGSTLEQPLPVGVTVWPRSAHAALLLARLVTGGLAVLQGTATLVGIPRGAPRVATEAALAAHGFARAGLLTTVLGGVLLVAGVLVVLGLLAVPAASALLAVAVVALGVAAPPAWAAQAPSALVTPLLGVALTGVVVLAGPGGIAPVRRRRRRSAVGLLWLVVGVAAAVVVLIVLR